MKKIFFLLSKGLIGIANNKDLPFARKLFLYTDYLRLIVLAILGVMLPDLTNSSVDKKFFVRSFKLTIYYPNIYSFLYIFNEIYCISDYSPFYNLKVYIDLGANIGLSVLWYHLFNPNMKIYAFEPDNLNYHFLKKNIKANNIKNCFIYEKAVSNKVKKVKFYRILDNIQNLDSGLSLNQNLPYKAFEVKAIKLSNLINKLNSVSLIKMDIEGSEYFVFEDLKRTNTLSHIDFIIFESHIFNNSQKKALSQAMVWLKRSGTIRPYRISKYTSTQLWQNNHRV